MTIKTGIVGLGAIGSAVYKALSEGIEGYELTAVSELNPPDNLSVPNLDFKELAESCDLVIECLPPAIVPDLAQEVFAAGKNLVVISSSTLLMFPEILEQHNRSKSRIIVPSGALIGIDGVRSLAQIGIRSARIASTKAPCGFEGAPYILEQNIDLSDVKTKTKIFEGNALEACKAFPANVNVAATLSLAGIGAEQTQVEIWADPEAKGNAHEITVESEYSVMRARVENMPDPKNPKSSVLAAQSIISVLKEMSEPFTVL